MIKLTSRLTKAVLIGVFVSLASSVQAGTFTTNKPAKAGDSSRWAESIIGKRRICIQGTEWGLTPTGSVASISWNETNNFNGGWSCNYDYKGFTNSGGDVINWFNVTQGWWWQNSGNVTPNSGLPKKYSSTLPSNASFSFSVSDTSTNPRWDSMVETYYHNSSSINGVPCTVEIMLRNNYSGRTIPSTWARVWLDGKWWRKNEKVGLEQVFVLESRSNSLSVKVQPFMQHNGQTSKWLSSLGAGFECYSGKAKFTVSSMSLNP